jgi:hypothetical protein
VRDTVCQVRITWEQDESAPGQAVESDRTVLHEVREERREGIRYCHGRYGHVYDSHLSHKDQYQQGQTHRASVGTDPLTEECGGDVHDRNGVRVTSSPFWADGSGDPDWDDAILP